MENKEMPLHLVSASRSGEFGIALASERLSNTTSVQDGMKQMRKSLCAVFVVMLLAASQAANALTITLGVGDGSGGATTLILGETFDPGDFAGGQAVRDAASINAVLALAPSTRSNAGGDPELYRSGNFPTLTNPADNATIVGAKLGDQNGGLNQIVYNGGGTKAVVTLPSNQTFKYLIGAYDGKNAGAEIWYIASVVSGTIIEIPRYAEPDGCCGGNGNLYESTRYQITTWTLFNPTDDQGQPLPDGGVTAVMLGLSMIGLRFLRRRQN